MTLNLLFFWMMKKKIPFPFVVTIAKKFQIAAILACGIRKMNRG